jgi:hypothetical protein
MQSSLPAEPTDRNIKAADVAKIGDIAKIVETATRTGAQSTTWERLYWTQKSLLERWLSLVLGPIDDLEHHSALEHFGFEVSGVQLPFGRCKDTESGFHALAFECIVGRHFPSGSNLDRLG